MVPNIPGSYTGMFLVLLIFLLFHFLSRSERCTQSCIEPYCSVRKIYSYEVFRL